VSFHPYPDDQLLPLVQAKYSQPVQERVINRHTYIHTNTYILAYIDTIIHFMQTCYPLNGEMRIQNACNIGSLPAIPCYTSLVLILNIHENLLNTICHYLFVSMFSEVYSTKPPLTTLLQYMFVKL
jgi:hypothetical protein